MPTKSGTFAQKKPSVYIRTFGCQMNNRDTEVICGLLKGKGYKITDVPAQADVVLLNTCSVRQHAEDRVWSEIGRFNVKPRASGHKLQQMPIIGIVGCMAQNHKQEIFRFSPAVDFIVGPADIFKIPQVIKDTLCRRKQSGRSGIKITEKVQETGSLERPEKIYHSGFYSDSRHAYVVISEGCSNYCSYCLVPYVRGGLRNRMHRDILKEISLAVSNGVKRITLLGQNVNAYLDVKVNFPGLLRLVNRVGGLDQFSFITSHPKDTTAELFEVMADLDKLKKDLHLPIQSGSNRILKLMKRGYTKDDYLKLVDQYRKVVEAGTLTTDIIVGFPTENELDFLDTYNLVKRVAFNGAFIFKYSTRPHTAASKLEDDIAKAEKKRRHKMILDLQRKLSKGEVCASHRP